MRLENERAVLFGASFDPISRAKPNLTGMERACTGVLAPEMGKLLF
jgi:hypothetical protein